MSAPEFHNLSRLARTEFYAVTEFQVTDESGRVELSLMILSESESLDRHVNQLPDEQGWYSEPRL